MTRILTSICLVIGLVGLSACTDEFNNSPEQKQFRAFVEKCKAKPELADCKAFEASKKDSPGG